ncbi:hypothetical protein IAU60_004031 [Kwoniella sp. DSM 27419]
MSQRSAPLQVPLAAHREVDPDTARAHDAIRARIQYHRARRRGDDPPDFLDFLNTLKRIVLSPITIPFRIIHQTITSPLTISLILKLILLGFLLLASSIFSVLAVGAFFWSWSTGDAIEVEGWLFYGSKTHRPPHVTVPIPMDKIADDLRYDIQVELELVRPTRGAIDDMGNFMLSLQLKSLRDPNTVLVQAAQPSLPPPSLQSALLSIPVLPMTYLPCVIPWPFRSLCPSRLLGYSSVPNSKIRERRIKGGFSSAGRGKDVVPLKKDLMEGVVLKPSRLPESTIGSAFVSIGREDLFDDTSRSREVKTTGWVVIRFTPRPTGIRWILSFHPLPPLLLLPPVSFALAFSSSIVGFALITFLRRPSRLNKREGPRKRVKSPAEVLADRSQATLDAKDREERREEERRQREWEDIQSVASGGLRKLDGSVGRPSTVGGSDTTAASTQRSFGPTLSAVTEASSASGSSDSASDSAQTVTQHEERGMDSEADGTGSTSGRSADEADSDTP